MSASLNGAAAALDEALRTLDRVLDETRAQWDDDARRSFDRRHGDQIVTGGKRAANELRQLADELASAVETLDGLG